MTGLSIFSAARPAFAALWLTMVCVSAQAADAAASPAQLLKPEGGPWPVEPAFDLDDKTRRSVSGIACAPGPGDRACLFVFDEGIEARHAVLRNGKFVAETGPVPLLAAGRELDAEGAASDGSYFYVVGSHSTSRTRCEDNPDSRHVIRFRVGPDGRALREPDGKLAGYQETGRLWDIMSSVEALKPHVGKCLGTQPPEKAPTLAGGLGANIEGLAIQDGRLYFGFRGPAREGVALILSVSADALFGGQPVQPALFRLVVGEGRGIRDLLTVKDGFLVLTGPDDDTRKEQPLSTVLFWDGKDFAGAVIQPKVLAQIDVSQARRPKCDKETKPEALALLAEGPTDYSVLVLSDGMCDGGALLFRLRR
jgi:hypothetical protein